MTHKTTEGCGSFRTLIGLELEGGGIYHKQQLAEEVDPGAAVSRNTERCYFCFVFVFYRIKLP